MASIQLTSPLVEKQFKNAGACRAGFTILGICLIALAIVLLGAPAMHGWYGILALIVIFIGSFGPATLLVVLWFKYDRPQSVLPG
jgi:predicted neutral ceramidase superfamily lipid hydrolase